VTSSASKSVSVLHASLRVAASQAREAGDHVTAAALDGEAQAIEDALLDAVREGLELLEAMACYVRTGLHSQDAGEWRDGKGLVATSWLHTISRDGDPQLHVHLAVLNAVQRADGVDDKWRAADGQYFYQLRHLYGVTVDRAFEQRLLGMGYAMVERADGNGAEVAGVSQQVMDRFSARARAIDGRLRTWVDRYTATHGTPPSRRAIYLMGREIAKDTRRPKAKAKRMAGGKDTGHPVSDEERLRAWEDQTTAAELSASLYLACLAGDGGDFIGQLRCTAQRRPFRTGRALCGRSSTRATAGTASTKRAHTWAVSSWSGPTPKAWRSASRRPSTWLSEDRVRHDRCRRLTPRAVRPASPGGQAQIPLPRPSPQTTGTQIVQICVHRRRLARFCLTAPNGGSLRAEPRPAPITQCDSSRRLMRR
jgi:hypothetical protein